MQSLFCLTDQFLDQSLCVSLLQRFSLLIIGIQFVQIIFALQRLPFHHWKFHWRCVLDGTLWSLSGVMDFFQQGFRLLFETSLVTEFNCSIKFKLIQKKVFGKIVVKIKHKFTKLCKKMLINIDIELPLSEQSDREKTVEEVTGSLMSIQRMNCAFGPSAMEIDANITETFSSLL